MKEGSEKKTAHHGWSIRRSRRSELVARIASSDRSRRSRRPSRRFPLSSICAPIFREATDESWPAALSRDSERFEERLEVRQLLCLEPDVEAGIVELDDGGQLVGYSKITRDITELHETQRTMQENQLQIAQMQKMEALGQLTGGVAHDFNNLLMVVSGYIPRIKQLLAGQPKGLQAAEAIERAAARGATLTRQLLSFSRRQSLRPTIVNLAETVEAARSILGST